jgi:HAE1 family hydrophobic/amphiphilic exporter-1
MNLTDLCIRRPVFATMLIGALVVLGLFAYSRLRVDLFPRIDIPAVTISTTLVGAGPEEIETRISKPIEEAINTINGIDELRSVTVEGLSQVLILFQLERSLDAAAQDVRDKVASIVYRFPEGTDPPVIDTFDIDATPIMYLTLSGSRDLKALTEIAKKRVKEPLESILGVGAIRLIGEREREIQVALSAPKLAGYGLTGPEVAQALSLQNVEVPGGRLITGRQETAVRTLGRVPNVEAFAHAQIANRDGKTIRVRDLGTVTDGVVEPRGLSRFNGTNAVTLSVRKQSGTNTVATVDAILARIPAVMDVLPAGVKLEVTRDWSHFIRQAVEDVQDHMIAGAILASIVVLLFMGNLRATLIAALAIPTSVIATFAALYAADYSLNRITLLALTLAVGIVIDDAIVVLENIWRFIEEKGKDPVRAAHEATREVALAVSATTLSLCVVFVPVGFVPGITGQFLSSFGFTMAFAIMISLFVAFTLTPMLSAQLLKPRGGDHQSRESRFYAPIDRGYSALLRWAMAHRPVVVLLALAIVASTPLLMRVAGAAFMPEDDRGEFEINLRLPQGASLQEVDSILGRLEATLRPIPGIRGLLTTVGGSAGDDVTAAQILVVLSDREGRSRHQHEIMHEARQQLRPFRSRVRVTVDNPPPVSGSGFGGSELRLDLRGPEQDYLDRGAARLRRIMETTPGVVDVDTSNVGGKPEIQLVIDRDKAADLGVSVANIARTIRMLVTGDVVTQYKEAGELYDVRLRLLAEDRERAAQLASLTVPSSKVGRVRLDNLVELRTGTGPAKIDRMSRQRQVSLYGNIAPGHAFGDILASILEQAGDLGLPAVYTLEVGGRGKLYEQTAAGFTVALTLSVIFMYIVLAAQFESFLHPLTIMLSLPLSVPFALFSLWVTGNTLNLFSGLGVLLLFGIVKKNSILQVDHTLALRRAGKPRLEAILEANRDRLRPILMTTISLVAAMIPATVGRGAGSEATRAIAIVVVGGQSLCLLITLLVTPVAYSLFDDLGDKSRQILPRFRAATKTPQPAGKKEQPDGYPV